MKNFPIYKDGKEYWVARNVAVVCFVFTYIKGEWYVLANQRGKGTPNYQGLWNCPCGYLDYNETTKQTAIREVYEETGLKINDAEFWSFNDDPEKDDLQNVTFRYVCYEHNPFELNSDSENRGGESDEVSDVKWIKVSEINNYEWAFGHEKLINEALYYKLKNL